MDGGAKVYVPDIDHVWLPAVVTSVLSTVYTTRIEEVNTVNGKIPNGMSLGAVVGQHRTLDLSSPDIAELIHSRSVKSEQKTVALPLQNPNKPFGFDDMISVDHLHEGAILYNIRQRFFGLLPYTYTGKICIAVNPYQWLDIYTKETMARYMEGDRDTKSPHVYSVSMESFYHMKTNRMNQSILVSGESGAGKTETTKIMMNHVASLSQCMNTNNSVVKANSSSGSNVTIIEQIIQANPLLESFGNAKTIRNDNSSRFGKFTELQFNKNNELIGALSQTYLLEKSRITHQSPNERNFHIFYQLVASCDQFPLLQLSNSQNVSYRYLMPDSSINSKQMGLEFDKTRHALNIIGISNEIQLEMFSILASILHLGELEFQTANNDPDSSELYDSSDVFEIVCELLKVSNPELLKALCFRHVFVGREVILKPMTVHQARNGRDALAKSLYSYLFTWLVTQINQCIGQELTKVSLYIGILDIFGFERFESNSFEQLCINYANEKLQQKFVSDVLKVIQLEYEEENIKWKHITFQDNQDVLNLIEGRLGVLSLLNEESMLATGSDVGLASKLSVVFENNVLFQVPKIKSTMFTIVHYAGKVTYDTNGFLEKHKDTLFPDIVTALHSSSLQLIQNMFPNAANDPNAKSNNRRQHSKRGLNSNNSSGNNIGGGAKSSRLNTVGSQFKESLSLLMEKIKLTNVHYVRCIKPNSIKSANAFDHISIVNQLRCAGVIEAIRVSRSAYPSRLSHLECVQNYKVLDDTFTTRALNNCNNDYKLVCEKLLSHILRDCEEYAYQIGTTRVYFRENVMDQLENLRFSKITSKATTIQKYMKRYVVQKKYQRMRVNAIRLQAWVRRCIAYRKFHVARKGIILCQAHYRGRKGRIFYLQFKNIILVTKVQAQIRCYLQRVKYLKVRKAVSTIQSFWRITFMRLMFLKCLAKEKKYQDLGSKVARLQTKLGSKNNNNSSNFANADAAGAAGSNYNVNSSTGNAANNNVNRSIPLHTSNSSNNLNGNNGTNNRPSTTGLFNESSEVLSALTEENEKLRVEVNKREAQLNLLKEEHRKLKEWQKTKEIDEKVKNMAYKTQEAKDLAYVTSLEEEYEKLRLFICEKFQLPSDHGKIPLSQLERQKSNADDNANSNISSNSTAIPAPPLSTQKSTGILAAHSSMEDLNITTSSVRKNEALSVLSRSSARLHRVKTRTHYKSGSARRVKDYWDEIKNIPIPMTYTLGSVPWKRLLTDWAQGNPKKLDYMNRWLKNVLEGGDIENGPFPMGVELKSVTPMMLEGFIQLVIPKLAERPDVNVHVHTKEFIGTSMRITLSVREGVPKMIPITLELSGAGSSSSQLSKSSSSSEMRMKERILKAQMQADPNSNSMQKRNDTEKWDRNSIMSVRSTASTLSNSLVE